MLEPFTLRIDFKDLEDFVEFMIDIPLEKFNVYLDSNGWIRADSKDFHVLGSTINSVLLKYPYINQTVTIFGVDMVINSEESEMGKCQLRLNII